MRIYHLMSCGSSQVFEDTTVVEPRVKRKRSLGACRGKSPLKPKLSSFELIICGYHCKSMSAQLCFSSNWRFLPVASSQKRGSQERRMKWKKEVEDARFFPKLQYSDPCKRRTKGSRLEVALSSCGYVDLSSNSK